MREIGWRTLGKMGWRRWREVDGSEIGFRGRIGRISGGPGVKGGEKGQGTEK